MTGYKLSIGLNSITETKFSKLFHLDSRK